MLCMTTNTNRFLLPLLLLLFSFITLSWSRFPRFEPHEFDKKLYEDKRMLLEMRRSKFNENGQKFINERYDMGRGRPIYPGPEGKYGDPINIPPPPPQTGENFALTNIQKKFRVFEVIAPNLLKGKFLNNYSPEFYQIQLNGLIIPGQPGEKHYDDALALVKEKTLNQIIFVKEISREDTLITAEVQGFRFYLNKLLIKLGLAKLNPEMEHNRLNTIYEEKAKKDKAGLWVDDNIEKANPDEL